MASDSVSERRSVRATASQPDPPEGWRGGFHGETRARYAYGSHIELDIRPRYLTKRAERRGQPSQFRVELRKRFYAHQLTGDVTILGTTDTVGAATAIAYQYMDAFVEDRREVAMETREELESDPVMAAEAEETIVSEAATEAAIDVAGYSDDLLRNDLRGLLEVNDASQPVLQAIVHRDGRNFDTVFVGEGFEAWDRGVTLREFYKEFDWLDEQKLATTLGVGEMTCMMGVFDETRMVRYLASEDEETLVLIDPTHPLHVPPFERQIADIVSAKWDRT